MRGDDGHPGRDGEREDASGYAEATIAEAGDGRAASGLHPTVLSTHQHDVNVPRSDRLSLALFI